MTANEEEFQSFKTKDFRLYQNQAHFELKKQMSETDQNLQALREDIIKTIDRNMTVQTVDKSMGLKEFLVEQFEQLEPKVKKKIAALDKKFEATTTGLERHDQEIEKVETHIKEVAK